jgi:hypothetical protein
MTVFYETSLERCVIRINLNAIFNNFLQSNENMAGATVARLAVGSCSDVQ